MTLFKHSSSKVRAVDDSNQSQAFAVECSKAVEKVLEKSLEKTKQESKRRDDEMFKKFQAAVDNREHKPDEQTAESRGVSKQSQGDRGRDGQKSDGPRRCYNCNKAVDGHIAKDCPLPRRERRADKNKTEEVKANEVNVNKLVIIPTFENYLEIKTKAGKITALVDTGCQFTCGPSKFLAQAKLTPCETALFNAGGTQLKVKGCTMLTFQVNGLTLTTEMIVSDELDELLIGANTLKENDAQWDIRTGILTINGTSIQLKTRSCKCNVRRIYVKQTTVIPSNHEALVPIELRSVNIYALESDWLLENRRIRNGLYTARAILSKSSAAVHVINLSGMDHKLTSGVSLGNAFATSVVEDFDQVKEVQTNLNSVYTAVINVAEVQKRIAQTVKVNSTTRAPDTDTDNTLIADNRESKTNSLTCDAKTMLQVSRPTMHCYSCLTKTPQERSVCTCGWTSREGHLTRRHSMMNETERWFHQSRNRTNSDSGMESSDGYRQKSELVPSERFKLVNQQLYDVQSKSAAEKVDSESVKPSQSSLAKISETFLNRLRPSEAYNDLGLQACNRMQNSEAYSRCEGPTRLLSGSEHVETAHSALVCSSEHMCSFVQRPSELCPDLDSRPVWSSNDGLSLRRCETFTKSCGLSVEGLADSCAGSAGAEGACPREVLLHGEYLSEDLSFLKPALDNLPDTLTVEERQQNFALLCEYKDIFSRSEFDVGCTKLIEATIDTGSQKPIAQKIRRQPIAYRQALQDVIDNLRDSDIIEPSSSPWCFNIVAVLKKDSTREQPKLRFTLDLRMLNECSKKDRYPLPHIGEAIDKLGKSRFYSSIDATQGFFNVPLRKADREKVAFCANDRMWHFKRMPQGFCNSSAVFCRLMSMVLKDLKWISCYLDDVTITGGNDVRDHLENVRAVFQRLREANIKIRADKTKLCRNSTVFLGFKISQEGLEINPSKAKSIESMSFPKRKRDLKSSLGLFQYFKCCVHDYSTIAEPLYAMLRTEATMEQTPERVNAWESLKRALIGPTVLKLPRDEGLFVVDTDASLFACSGILNQEQDGELVVCEYASRCFTKQERNYSADRREMLAVLFALKFFRTYLLGRYFIVRTDNTVVEHYYNAKEPTAQMVRHLDFMAQYDVHFVHRAGKLHGNADGLSRVPACDRVGGEPCTQCTTRINGEHTDVSVSAVQTRAQARRELEHKPFDIRLPDDEPLQQNQATADRKEIPKRNRKISQRFPALPDGVSDWNLEFLAKCQAEDVNIAPAIVWVRDQSRPDVKSMQSASPYTRTLWRYYDTLVIRDNVLYRIFLKSDGTAKYFQYVVPRVIKKQVMELAHIDASAHLRLLKTLDQVQRRAWWHTWKQDVERYLDCCKPCAIYHRGKTPKQGKLQAFVAAFPFQRISIDLCGPFVSSDNKIFIFSCVDLFTKYCVLVAIGNKESQTVARVLVDQVFLRHGVPDVLFSDNGSEFNANLDKDLFKFFGIKHITTLPYSPNQNGCKERGNRTINSMMAKLVDENQRNWSNFVKYIEFTYNATKSSVTGMTPNMALLGREIPWRIDKVLGSTDDDVTLPEYVQQTRDRLEIAHDIVRAKLGRSAQYSSEYYNRSVSETEFSPGQDVYFYSPRQFRFRSPKWHSNYRTEAKIVRRLSEVTYVVRIKNAKQDVLAHVDRLKPIQVYQ